MSTLPTTEIGSPDGPADTRIMAIVHRALARDLARTRTALAVAPYPATDQREAIADHLVWMMGFLTHHHESEEEHLYPLVRERSTTAAALLDDMTADHTAVVIASEAMIGAARAYREDRDARADVLVALDELEATLLPHLEREVAELMPIASATVTKREWEHWDEEFNVKPLSLREKSECGLWFLDGLPDDERPLVTELVPPVPRWIIVNLMAGGYRKRAFRRWRDPQLSPLKLPISGGAEVTTTASPAAVWAVLADPTRVPEWSHECARVEWLDGATAIGEGVRFRGTNQAGRMRWSRPCTVTTCRAAEELAYETDGGIVGDNAEWRFVLEPTGDGTRIVQSFRILSLPVWFDRVIWRLVPTHQDRSAALHADLERLSALAQQQPATTSLAAAG